MVPPKGERLRVNAVIYVLGLPCILTDCWPIVEYSKLLYIIDMHVISKKALTDFFALHATAESGLTAWHQVMEASAFECFVQLKQTFGSADWVKPYVIFDIAGNHFRLICVFHFNKQRVYIRHVFTHSEYDQWNSKKATK
jgi:mRNA interferase HigB